MPIRCKSIAGQRVTLGPGEPIIPGCELIEGSGIFENKEEFLIVIIRLKISNSV